MKKLFTSIFLLFIGLAVFAQSPTTFNYQAVLHDASGGILTNQEEEIGIALLQGSASGTEVFTETHSVTTNEFGLVNLQIGSVNTVDMETIDWSAGPYFIQISVDGTVMGTSQLLSVPYALHVKTAETVENVTVDYGDVTNTPDLSNFDQDASDDFDGDYNNLTNTPDLSGYLTSEVDGDATNEIQDLQLTGNILTITNNGTATDIDLSAYLDNTDTQLTDGEITALGYIKNADDADADATNEIQDLQLTGNILTITNNGTATDIDLSAYLDNTDTQLTDGEITALGYIKNADDADADATNEIQDLQLTGNILTITNNGTATDIDLSAYLDNTDTQLTDGEITALGYIKNADDADADATNEIQDLQLTGNILTITNNGTATDIDLSAYLDNTDTQLTDGEITALGYIKNADDADADADATNEIQDLQLTGNILTITNNGTATDIDLSAYLDNTDTQLTDGEITALGYIKNADDGDADATNEIQDLQLTGNILTITNNGTATDIDLSAYLDNTDTQLTDAEIATMGYIKNADDADADATNEIQDLQLTGNILTITNNGTATDIDLSAYLDNTDTQLTDAEIATMGYIKNADETDPVFTAWDKDYADLINTPAPADGSETKVTAGTNVTVTGSGTTASPYVVNASPYAVGDFAQGGVVFGVDETGQHGLVCAIKDQNSSAEWSVGNNNIWTYATGKGIYAGEMNTFLIIAKYTEEANIGTGYAAKICADYYVTQNGVMYGDWYLPSYEELRKMYDRKTKINATATANNGNALAGDKYWSSFEEENSTVRTILFANGNYFHTNKNTKYHVRAIRAF